jgi:carbon storage regulator
VLALTRKKGESIIIASNIEVIILSVHGEQVRLGIIAPKEIPIYRKELFEQIMSENSEATRHLNVEAMKNILDNNDNEKP